MGTEESARAEWKGLCEEHDAAQHAYFRAFDAVNRKFAAVGNTVSPTNEELAQFEATWIHVREIRERMTTFVKENA